MIACLLGEEDDVVDAEINDVEHHEENIKQNLNHEELDAVQAYL